MDLIHEEMMIGCQFHRNHHFKALIEFINYISIYILYFNHLCVKGEFSLGTLIQLNVLQYSLLLILSLLSTHDYDNI